MTSHPGIILYTWPLAGAHITPNDSGRGTALPKTPLNAWALPKSEKMILIVDDNMDAADSLGELFHELGYKTLVRYRGKEGLEVFQKTEPEIIFLDIAMPEMDGYELAREIRKSAPPGTILVAITGFGQLNDKQKAEEAGFDYHLTKPVNFTILRDILEKHL